MSYKSWIEDVSPEARGTLIDLGDFSPTSDFSQLKGWTKEDDGTHKIYWTASDLRLMSRHFLEVADWMEKQS